ncbi:MAG: hypothetical protein NZ903_01340 [Candidatus Micrarchaeota archaeon]|nr:hypothetical protein [Candidatus Micrarchaeota archaeon]
MKEIRASKEYFLSLLSKILIILLVFWGIVYLLVELLESIGLKIEFSPAQENSIVILTLFIITFLILSIIAFVYYVLFVKPKRLYIEESGIKIVESFSKKENFVPYSELSDAHCEEEIIGTIDKFFKIKSVKIHGTNTFLMKGIQNADDIVNEIRFKIESKKEKKIDPIVQLSEEIKMLKNEINELKLSIENLKKSTKESKKTTDKKRFVLGPFEDTI